MRPTLITVAALLLAACGTTSPAEPAADAPAVDAQATPEAEPEEPAPEEPAAEEWPEAEPPEDPDTWTPPPAEERENEADEGVEQEDAPLATTTTTTTTDAPAEPEAVDPCAGSPTVLSVADGPAPDIAVTPEAETASPLPDLAVRRINCGGGWVNLRNEIPSDLPVLIWAWAPH